MAENQQKPTQQLFYLALAALAVVVLVAIYLLTSKDDKKNEPMTLLPPSFEQNSMNKSEPVVEDTIDDVIEEAQESKIEPVVVPKPTVEKTEAIKEVELPLPTLDDSDKDVKQHLLSLNWRSGLAGLFITEEMLRNFVVQVDNIAQGQLATGHALLKPLEQKFSLKEHEPLMLTNDSFSRYTPYIQLIESVSKPNLVALYKRYESLLQEAYAELGYPDEPFKQKLMQAIDMLLATPDLNYPLNLSRPSVIYVFEDSEIEQLPDAQKQLIRLGPDNLKRLKAVLQDYKQLLK